MGCFLSCLRARDDNDHHRLPTSQHKSTGIGTSQNPLSSFLHKAFKRKEHTSHIEEDNLGLGSQKDDKGIKDEVTFLNSCDSSEGNHLKIWNASEKSEVLPCSIDSESSRFHSCLPNTSFEKLQLQVQSFIPSTPLKLSEERRIGKDSLKRTPRSSPSIAQGSQCDSLSSDDERIGSLHTVHGTCANETENNSASATPAPPAIDIQMRNKSSCFEYETDLSSYRYKQSPYPTPLKISDEMQTPGTVYPVKIKNQPNDKPRVRSQILHSNNNLAKNISQREILEEKENFHPEQDLSELSRSIEQLQNVTPAPKIGLKETSYDNEDKVKASLSSWVKTASVINKDRNNRMKTTFNQIPHLCKSPADRPIIGVVAVHWNEDENPNNLSPKSWDGNGIPNTTNKYKEDKKVNWHATPFEERLDKALSEKSLISQRKPNAFGNEDNDTALSQLQPTTHPSL